MARTFHHGDRAKKIKFGKYWWWYRSTPSWWINEFMTRPQRQEVRHLIQQVLRLNDLEDAPEFPLAKKPYLYYW